VVTPFIDEAGEYWFSVERVGRPPESYRVDGVIGGGHMEGGGTQGFVSRFPDGTVRFLPFDFVREEGVWFCNTANILGWWTTEADLAGPRLDSGWVPVTREMRLADCGDWPPLRTLGTTTAFQNCQECHGSQILLSFESERRKFKTEFTSLTVNCESCHGPARKHVEWAESGAMGEEIGLPSLTVMEKDESLEICFRCHAVKQPLATGYLPAMKLEEYYSLKAPLWIDEPLLPDGRVRTFAYQANHLYSDCYLNGSMTCVDCHAPHGLEYRDVWDRPLNGRFDDGQCLGCHPSRAADPESHTHHPTGSRGSGCVGCHMPYRQHPTVGGTIRFSRSDHTIPVPRPQVDQQMGLPSACALCHPDRSAEELQETVDEWYGGSDPRHPLVEALLAVSPETGEAEARTLLLRPEESHVMAQTQALWVYVRRYLSPDMEGLSVASQRALKQLAGADDPDIKAMALAALHLALGDEPEVRADLAQAMAALQDRDWAVRRRWVLILRTLGDRYLDAGEVGEAVRAYEKALEVIPEHPGVFSDLALAASSVGESEEALTLYDRSLVADPNQSQVLVNRGVVLENLGRGEEAIASFQEAAEKNPGEALAHLNLGNVHFVRGEYPEAVESYRRAVVNNPRLVNGHLMLAQSLILLGMPDSAAISARNVLEFDPVNDAAQRMLRDLLRGGPPGGPSPSRLP
jgi:tetratricopeptide (TPR) repeat protein